MIKKIPLIKKSIENLIIGVAVCAFILGMLWVFKHASYLFFYKNLTKTTIQETVKSECLK